MHEALLRIRNPSIYNEARAGNMVTQLYIGLDKFFFFSTYYAILVFSIFLPIILFKRPIILFVLPIIPNFDRMKQPIVHILHECQ